MGMALCITNVASCIIWASSFALRVGPGTLYSSMASAADWMKSRTSSRALIRAVMSSRSNGVTKVRWRRWIISCVMASPVFSIPLIALALISTSRQSSSMLTRALPASTRFTASCSNRSKNLESLRCNENLGTIPPPSVGRRCYCWASSAFSPEGMLSMPGVRGILSYSHDLGRELLVHLLHRRQGDGSAVFRVSFDSLGARQLLEQPVQFLGLAGNDGVALFIDAAAGAVSYHL